MSERDLSCGFLEFRTGGWVPDANGTGHKKCVMVLVVVEVRAICGGLIIVSISSDEDLITAWRHLM